MFWTDLSSTLGNSVTEITYSNSLSSPYVFKSNLGCPAGFILLSAKALVVESFRTLSKTSPKIAGPNCLLRISFGTVRGLKPYNLTVFLRDIGT